MIMTLETIRAALAWCTLINWGLLLLWFLFFISAKDWIYGIHSKWYNLSRESFHSIHYTGMLVFKMAVLFFNLAPYLALRIVG
jgi:hypothetical protein